MKDLRKVILALMLLMMALVLNAQDESKRYYSMDYMKVTPENVEDYLACEQAWKKIHQHRIDQGEVEGWTLEMVVSPNGADQAYNFITRQRFKDTDQVAAYQMDDFTKMDLKSILTEEEIKLVKRTEELRTWVKNEMWSSEELVLSEDVKDAKYNVFNYFKMPKDVRRSAHLEMERELWMPVHQERINKGQTMGWVLLNRELPLAKYDYDVATVDVYKDMNQFWAEMDEAVFEKVHPNKTFEEVWKATMSAGQRERAEIRKEIDSITREKTSAGED